MKMIIHTGIATILGLGLPAISNAQTTLLSQPFSTDGNLTSSPQYTFAGYDDFTLSGGGTVNQVMWWGLDFGGITGFTISFWTDQGGLPGTLLVSDNIPGVPGETYAGTTPMADVPIDSYSSALATPFSAVPGTAYLISIVVNSGNWCWEASDVGNQGVEQWEHTSYYHFGYNGAAFDLEGTEVPEPGTIALGLFGASVFLFRRHR